MTARPSWESLVAAIDRADGEARAASAALRALSGGGPMGLTPDAVKASPAWRAAREQYERAAAMLAHLSGQGMRHHKAAMIARARAHRAAGKAGA